MKRNPRPTRPPTEDICGRVDSVWWRAATGRNANVGEGAHASDGRAFYLSVNAEG